MKAAFWASRRSQPKFCVLFDIEAHWGVLIFLENFSIMTIPLTQNIHVSVCTCTCKSMKKHPYLSKRQKFWANYYVLNNLSRKNSCYPLLIINHRQVIFLPVIIDYLWYAIHYSVGTRLNCGGIVHGPEAWTWDRWAFSISSKSSFSASRIFSFSIDVRYLGAHARWYLVSWTVWLIRLWSCSVLY